MKRVYLIIIFFVIFVIRTTYGYNKMIPVSSGFYNAVTGNSFDDDTISLEGLIYNPAVLENRFDIELSYIYKKSPLMDTLDFIAIRGGSDKIGYSLFMNNNIFYDNNNRYKNLIAGGALSHYIGGIYIGIGIKLNNLSYNSGNSKANNYQLYTGIKKEGRLGVGNVKVSLSYNSSVKINWDNEIVSYTKIPATIIGGVSFLRGNIEVFYRLLYIFPFTANDNSNFSSINENNEIRISLGILYQSMILNKNVNFMMGYNYIEKDMQILGLGFSLSITDNLNLNAGISSSKIINSESDYNSFNGGINILF